MANESKLK